jgi:hypothetical protein
MTPRGRGFNGGPAVVAAGVTLLAVAACTSSGKSCADNVAAGEAKVRTTTWEDAADLPGLGEYTEIHWQVDALGNPCSRAPGPTDWAYQGVVRLRPDDARALAAAYEWQPIAVDPPDNPVEVWPALATYVPADAGWLRSDAYDELPPQIKWRRLYFDPDRGVALFVLNDH